jgi:hypothetical protein
MKVVSHLRKQNLSKEFLPPYPLFSFFLVANDGSGAGEFAAGENVGEGVDPPHCANATETEQLINERFLHGVHP